MPFVAKQGRPSPRVVLGTSGAVTIDRLAGERFLLAPTAAVTLSVSNDYNDALFQVHVAASAFAVTWFAGIKWPGGSPPALPTVAGRRTTIGFYRAASGDYDAFLSPEVF